MRRNTFCLFAVLLMLFAGAAVSADFTVDTFDTGQGELKITLIGHGTLMFEWEGQVVHVDPVGNYADYSKLPKADIVLITHEHGDHLDPESLGKVKKEGTLILANSASAAKIEGATAVKNGESRTAGDIRVEAVPAYNLVHKQESGEPFHPKGRDNGYVLTFGDKRVYVAGDTENTPEMKALKNIDVAFLPMNLPYTMTPEMAADAARAFRPKILYPYHYGKTDPKRLVELLKGVDGVEVRIRAMQ